MDLVGIMFLLFECYANQIYLHYSLTTSSGYAYGVDKLCDERREGVVLFTPVDRRCATVGRVPHTFHHFLQDSHFGTLFL